MDDVISLSSGSEEDSDIEFVSSYKDDSSSGVPFIRAELLPVTPVSLSYSTFSLSPSLNNFYFQSILVII